VVETNHCCFAIKLWPTGLLACQQHFYLACWCASSQGRTCLPAAGFGRVRTGISMLLFPQVSLVSGYLLISWWISHSGRVLLAPPPSTRGCGNMDPLPRGLVVFTPAPSFFHVAWQGHAVGSKWGTDL